MSQCKSFTKVGCLQSLTLLCVQCPLSPAPAGGVGDLHLKYLTSSKLTKLQLADSAFQRTVLTQCLIFLDACLHRPFPADEQNPPGLKEAQVGCPLGGQEEHSLL